MSSAITTLYQSSIGKKAVMAITGFIMIFWVFLHLMGNLLVFAGQEHFNRYSHFIQSGFGVEPALLWLMRIVMFVSVIAHVWAAVGLNQRNRSARPVAYQGGRRDRITNPAARYMMGLGVVILLYLVFHLAHLTFGVWSDDALQRAVFVREDAYRNLVVGLSNPVVGTFYILANFALAGHLYHGTQSAFQTLGVNDPRWNPLRFGLTRWVPVLFAGAATVISLACMFGIGTVLEAPDLSWTPNF